VDSSPPRLATDRSLNCAAVTEVLSENPLPLLADWIAEAGAVAGVGDPVPVTLCTVNADGVPSSRTIGLKRIDDDALIFTTALWTRKARDIADTPHVSMLFHWPPLGRQVHVAGIAAQADRATAEALFEERPLAHRLQTVVSRQGDPIASVEPLHARLAELAEDPRPTAACPPDWGAVVVRPHAVEFWEQASDRLHERLLWERRANGWTLVRLSP